MTQRSKLKDAIGSVVGVIITIGLGILLFVWFNSKHGHSETFAVNVPSKQHQNWTITPNPKWYDGNLDIRVQFEHVAGSDARIMLTDLGNGVLFASGLAEHAKALDENLDLRHVAKDVSTDWVTVRQHLSNIQVFVINGEGDVPVIGKLKVSYRPGSETTQTTERRSSRLQNQPRPASTAKSRVDDRIVAQRFAEEAGRQIMDHIGGGQDLIVDLLGFEYDRAAQIYRIDFKVSFNGSIERSTPYRVEARLTVNEDGSKPYIARRSANQNYLDQEQFVGNLKLLDNLSKALEEGARN